MKDGAHHAETRRCVVRCVRPWHDGSNSSRRYFQTVQECAVTNFPLVLPSWHDNEVCKRNRNSPSEVWNEIDIDTERATAEIGERGKGKLEDLPPISSPIHLSNTSFSLMREQRKFCEVVVMFSSILYYTQTRRRWLPPSYIGSSDRGQDPPTTLGPRSYFVPSLTMGTFSVFPTAMAVRYSSTSQATFVLSALYQVQADGRHWLVHRTTESA